MKEIRITDIENIKIGSAENKEAGTGCTVIICERGADSLGEIPLAGRDGYSVVTAAPVITEGDVSGCVAFVSDKEDAVSSEVLLSLCQSAAQFLARCAAV